MNSANSSEDPIKLVVLVSGSGSNLQSIISACEERLLNANISLVISNHQNAYALKRANQAGICSAVIRPDKGESRERYDQRLFAEISQHNPDLIILAGFMRILSAQFVAQFHGRIMNIHPSLLPKYKGTNTHQRALDNRDTEHGATVHIVTAELDDGPILLQAKVPVLPTDNAESLRLRVLEQEHLIYPKAIKNYADNDFQI